MRSQIRSIVLTALLLGSALFVFAPALAQAGDLLIEDPVNDVALSAYARTGVIPVGTPAQTLPVTLPGGTDPIGGIVDLREVRVFGETPTQLSLAYKVQSFERANSYAPTNVYHRICFTWDGTGGHYQFQIQFTFGTPGAAPTTLPKLADVWFERLAAPCDPFTTPAVNAPRIHQTSFTVLPDYTANEVVITVHRKQFEELNANQAQGEKDPRPASGDKLSGVRAFATAGQGPGKFLVDETSVGEFTFAADTGNEAVRVVVPDKVISNYGLQAFGIPTYGVEIGSYQVVPITIENDLDVPIEPQISVNIVQGDAAKWEVRTLPSIPVGKRIGDVPGRETVSLVVNSDPTVSHKETLRLIISALDPAQPRHLGAALVNLVAVKPPTVGDATLYFHGTGESCGTNARWMNTMQEDATAAGTEIDFRGCNPQGDGAFDRYITSGEVGRTFHRDVPFSRDYVLSTTETAKAQIELKSVFRVPGQEPVDLPVAMVGDIIVEIFSGTTVLGKNTLESVAIPGEDTMFNLEIPIQGRILGGFGREAPDDKPLNVRVAVVPQARTIEYCAETPCGFEGEQEVPSPSGKVFMLFGQSSITLPIVESERSGEIVNITKSGALISLRLSEGENMVFTNPGRIVVFNMTVRNEGVNVDTAKLSATVNRTGWNVEILPTKEYELKMGQARQFNVRITAPATAREGERVRIDLYAASTVDPEATARVPLVIEATTQQQFEDQPLDPNLQQLDESQKSPAPAFLPLALALLGLIALARRRRL